MLHEFDTSNAFLEIPADSRIDPDPFRGKFDRLWSIVLAGGRGTRLGSFVRQWRGRHIPKQYCAFVGTRSMLQHTLDRVVSLGQYDHQFTVIARSHQRDAEYQLADRPPDTVIVQPTNRDTLPGIYLPLTYVYARDEGSTVAIYPSDHFVYPEKAFAAWMARAVHATEALSDRILLVGVPAKGPEPEYGWIAPGLELWHNGKYSICAIESFLEKPSPEKAGVLLASGYLWNTMIVIARARALWQLGWKLFPETMRLFTRLKDAVGTSREAAVLEAIYKMMPAHNFSADLLAQAKGKTAVLSMEGILWSDWGNAERISATLQRIGKHPNFPTTILESNNALQKNHKEQMRNHSIQGRKLWLQN